MLTIAKIRRAAAALKERGTSEITTASLASEIGCDKAEVGRYLNGINGLKEEIGASTGDVFSGPVYEDAAKKLSVEDKLVTLQSLAEKTGKEYTAVRAFFSRYPAWAVRVGLLSERQVELKKMRRRYIDAIAKLRGNGGTVTITAIATEVGRPRSKVSVDFTKRFSIVQLTEEAVASLQTTTAPE
jgi:hypothetical protein